MCSTKSSLGSFPISGLPALSWVPPEPRPAERPSGRGQGGRPDTRSALRRSHATRGLSSRSCPQPKPGADQASGPRWEGRKSAWAAAGRRPSRGTAPGPAGGSVIGAQGLEMEGQTFAEPWSRSPEEDYLSARRRSQRPGRAGGAEAWSVPFPLPPHDTPSALYAQGTRPRGT